jgi:hypothetical protein
MINKLLENLETEKRALISSVYVLRERKQELYHLTRPE